MAVKSARRSVVHLNIVSMDIVRRYIKGNYKYINVAASNIDYAVERNGISALAQLGISGEQYTILDSSQNYTSKQILQRIADSMIHCNIPGIVLSSDPYLNTEKVKYFPYFALYGITAWQTEQSYNPVYLYSCLNRKPHLHRILNWYELKDIPNGLWSMYNLNEHDQFTHPILTRWAQDRQLLPDTCENDLTDCHAAYHSSYINLVTETVMNESVFISEKTWKPIANGQLFLIAGCAGTVEYLRSIGVDVFDDIIDHSYDVEPDWTNRLRKFQDSFKKLINNNIADIWQQTTHRRQQNAQKFFDNVFADPYLEQIKVDT